MLRRTPSTLLVCLVLFLSTVLINTAWPADPQEALDVLLKPNDAGATADVKRHKAKPRPGYIAVPPPVPFLAPYPPPAGITKVKAPAACPVVPYGAPCILPQPLPRQWDMSVQFIFARTRGTIAWPRNSWWYTGWWGSGNEADLNDNLGLPAHWTLVQFTARYQFRPNWAVRYSILPFEISGGRGWWDYWSWNQFVFGPLLVTPGLPYNSKWQHQYHRLGLVYDAVKTCSTVLSVFADWVHTEDQISLNCISCGFQTAIFSKGGDSAIAGLELQQCIKTTWNGATLSCDYKAGFIFLDDVQGWDIQLGLKYTIPLGCGRWGYTKGGYRFIDYKKSQPDILFENAIEGGFWEFGFIF